jgi:hypothetical protein
MTDQQENLLIQTKARDVSEVLLQVEQLDLWNPAFLSISADPTALIGQPHPIRVRGGLSGHFQYDLISPERIESSWQVPGFRETNHWQLHVAAEQSTVVAHDFVRSGPLAAVSRPATGRLAQRRLARLKTRVEALADPNDRVG